MTEILYWRMVRDSNPRTSCPVSGFQDRRIRPLCQPSFNSSTAGLSNLRFCSRFASGDAAYHSFALGCALLASLTRTQDRRIRPLCQPSETIGTNKYHNRNVIAFFFKTQL